MYGYDHDVSGWGYAWMGIGMIAPAATSGSPSLTVAVSRCGSRLSSQHEMSAASTV